MADADPATASAGANADGPGRPALQQVLSEESSTVQGPFQNTEQKAMSPPTSSFGRRCRSLFWSGVTVVLLGVLMAVFLLVGMVIHQLLRRSKSRDIYCGEMSCYDLLGISSSADGRSVKKAYREAALLYHPDKSSAPDAQEKFVKVSTAYDVLSDPVSRSEYDYYLANPQHELRNNYQKARWDYQSHWRATPVRIFWLCLFAAFVLYWLCMPVYQRLSYFAWRKLHGVPATFDRSKRSAFLQNLEASTAAQQSPGAGGIQNPSALASNRERPVPSRASQAAVRRR
eukprot:gnl/TRDRNA2_/TRDRNA2_127188_c0_seq2.p1 gnl/TRDRNA2_/TRDRNA2_127188_c0~~gnl/TRDRNA2_/TRDRNA2_127188_c0_seq2.p1  ORF type:complete len:302 (+),score=38.97 gnl/TRDRNA2_/TRDRNA2_127188_c0_seq2:51-908(+)